MCFVQTGEARPANFHRACRLFSGRGPVFRAALTAWARPVRYALPEFPNVRGRPMKVRSSLKSLKTRHRDCQVVRRKGRVYVINKTDPRFKAKQG